MGSPIEPTAIHGMVAPIGMSTATDMVPARPDYGWGNPPAIKLSSWLGSMGLVKW